MSGQFKEEFRKQFEMYLKNKLEKHGIKTVRVEVFDNSGNLDFRLSGSEDDVKRAEFILRRLKDSS